MLTNVPDSYFLTGNHASAPQNEMIGVDEAEARDYE